MDSSCQCLRTHLLPSRTNFRGLDNRIIFSSVRLQNKMIGLSHVSSPNMPHSSNRISQSRFLESSEHVRRIKTCASSEIYNKSAVEPKSLASTALVTLVSVGLWMTLPLAAHAKSSQPESVEKQRTKVERSLQLERERQASGRRRNISETANTSPDMKVFLEQYLAENPREILALKAVLKLKMEEGKFEEGIQILSRLIQEEPMKTDWRIARGQTYELVGNMEKAKEDFEFVLKLEPYSAKALQGLTAVMQRNGESSLVLDMLEGAVQRATSEKKLVEATNLKLLLAQVHAMQGNLSEALEHYDTLIKEDPEDFRPYLCQGLVYSLVGDKEKADSSFIEFQKRCPDEFSERGGIHDMVIKAKAAARRLKENDRRREKAELKGVSSSGELKEPQLFVSDQPER